MTDDELVNEAMLARKMAYVPYSHHAVGAALLTKSGKVYRGCNIENAAFTPTNCAERTAVFKAVSEGEKDVEAIAIVGGPVNSEKLHICPPCGVCRQVLREFTNPKTFRVILGATDPAETKKMVLEDVLPYSFGPENMDFV